MNKMPIQIEISFEQNIDFNFKSQHIALYLENQILGIKMGRIRKINFIFDKSRESIKVVGSKTNVCNVYMKDDFLSFNSHKLMVDIFVGFNTLINDHYHEIKLDLDNILRMANDLNYIFKVPYIKKVFNRDRSLYGIVECVMTEDFFDLIVGVFDKKEMLIFEKSIIKADTNILLCRRFFNRAYWNNENLFVVSDNMGELEFDIDPFGDIKIKINPIENSIDEIAGYLKALHYKTDRKERLKLLSR
jgi:hypothetical protein